MKDFLLTYETHLFNFDRQHRGDNELYVIIAAAPLKPEFNKAP